MFDKETLEKYADVLFWGLSTARKDSFKKGDVILVQYDPAALNLAEILYRKVLERGMYPIQRMGLTNAMEHSFYEMASASQLKYLPPGDKELYQALNGRIFLRAPGSLTHLKDIDPSRIGQVLVARKPFREIMDKREEKGVYSWTLCTYPTPGLAKQAKMPLSTYAGQIKKACFLDLEDPVRKWEDVHAQATEVKKWLSGLKVKYFRIVSSSMDLVITPGDKRKWAGVSGHNIPSFEVFLSPDFRGTEGVYYANLPSFRSGNYVEGVRLVFKKGKVVEADAKKGGEFLKKQIAMDKGASRVGEFSLTDKRFSLIDRFMADTLFDENFGGTFGNCHLALGSSYSDTFSGNPARLNREMKIRLGFNDSALHWDLVNTEPKTVTAHLTNGREIVIYEDGMFRNR
ncbi:MAG: aminopeptidase [Syntrophorhabdaceae bacterium]|nr:aminopeptidase [Syntrophorhabdaceae bacterium]MDD4195664.1 aminopeptidase [Syntrophorhabdaceae bacterium]